MGIISNLKKNSDIYIYVTGLVLSIIEASYIYI